MFVCSCFGVTEQQVRDHAAAGACTPRQIASASGAGTDCGSCVRRIQGILGRGCPRREGSVGGAVAAVVSGPPTGARVAAGPSPESVIPGLPAAPPARPLPVAA
ncbi:bacterioferritin-associated ferredoxin [Streptomyces sp. ST2-7A]|uniref:(2Fe-2S)-binding protein n=1 Tax=Streptomyces sp. ST2-7A TaxID=2907214 RepID=UPI001F33398E|nr:(2Fe-2S)-binding protein [Streptomyces sp. ST2-7A]MCE7083292.1 (2Fe-2S)-binding protein [Streptomyces sp. ST2-7A]